MHALAERLGDSAGKSKIRPFAVGPCDMHDGRQAPFGMAECRKQAFDAPER
jgi:hypothetical protein